MEADENHNADATNDDGDDLVDGDEVPENVADADYPEEEAADEDEVPENDEADGDYPEGNDDTELPEDDGSDYPKVLFV